MHFVKDIFENNKTEHSHNKFIRYSKGDFVGPLMKIRLSKQTVKIAASFHYADELFILLAEYLGHQIVHIKGSLVWNQDLTVDLAKLGIKYSKVTKSRGIFKYVLENDVDIVDFVESMGKYNILANIKGDDFSFVTKTSFPKPNKEFGPDFVKVTLPASFTERVLEEFAFDVKEKIKKLVEIKQQFIIDDIILPEDKSEFDKARRLATRKGKIYRNITADGTELLTEIDINI